MGSVDPTSGEVGLYPVKDVVKHRTGDRPSVGVLTPDGREVRTTCDHSLFRLRADGGVEPVEAGVLDEQDHVVEVSEAGAVAEVAVHTENLPPLEVSYDLCVPGPENFVLSNGLLAHNSYSIGGISLDIDKSSKYMDLKRNAEEQWDKMTESKTRTEKYAIGLAQPRFGRGVRSAFGPYVGRGALSPRSFVVWLIGFGGVSWMAEALHHVHHVSTLLT